jgi:hypothetical protein
MLENSMRKIVELEQVIDPIQNVFFFRQKISIFYFMIVSIVFYTIMESHGQQQQQVKQRHDSVLFSNIC